MKYYINRNLIKLMYSLVVTISCAFLFFCNGCDTTDLNTEGKNELNKVTGYYKAIVFIAPSPNDKPVDILANGGMFTVRLSSNYRAEWRLVIPLEIAFSSTPIDTSNECMFRLNGDTLRFKGITYYLDVIPFLLKDTQLEAIPIGRAPIILTLKKY